MSKRYKDMSQEEIEEIKLLQAQYSSEDKGSEFEIVYLPEGEEAEVWETASRAFDYSVYNDIASLTEEEEASLSRLWVTEQPDSAED